MRKISILAIALALVALPCLGDVFSLRDGTEVDGTVSRISADGRITIKMKTGVRTYQLSEFSADTIETHFADVKVSAPKPPPSARKPPSSQTHTTRETASQTAKPKAALGLMGVGAVLITVGALWMIIAAFAESPVWGIAFLLSAGIAELAFIFVHWERAKSPLVTQCFGVALFIAAVVLVK